MYSVSCFFSLVPQYGPVIVSVEPESVHCVMLKFERHPVVKNGPTTIFVVCVYPVVTLSTYYTVCICL